VSDTIFVYEEHQEIIRRYAVFAATREEADEKRLGGDEHLIHVKVNPEIDRVEVAIFYDLETATNALPVGVAEVY
jgi:hypothetical protein